MRALEIYGCRAALLLFVFSVIAAAGLTVDGDEVKGLMGLRDPGTAFVAALLRVCDPPLFDSLPIDLAFMLPSPLLPAQMLALATGTPRA